jgi:hypothetical protein
MSPDEVAGMLEGSAIDQAAVNANGMQKPVSSLRP